MSMTHDHVLSSLPLHLHLWSQVEFLMTNDSERKNLALPAYLPLQSHWSIHEGQS